VPKTPRDTKDVQGGCHRQCEVGRAREVLRGFGKVAAGEADHREAQEGEERERDARDDVDGGRVRRPGEQVGLELGQRDDDEHREDRQQDDDDPRLDPVDELGAGDVDDCNQQYDGDGQDVVPGSPGIVAEQQGGAVAAE
jgi:hypothetical protein